MKRALIAALALAAACTGSAYAASGEPLKECVSFSGNQEVSRYGNQYVLIHDGDAYYRLYAERCGRLSMATRLTLRADAQVDRICPEDTRIETNAGDCTASKAEIIDEATYKRLRRR